MAVGFFVGSASSADKSSSSADKSAGSGVGEGGGEVKITFTSASRGRGVKSPRFVVRRPKITPKIVRTKRASTSFILREVVIAKIL